MLFNSIDFLIFFPIVILIYYVIPNRIKYIWLLVASYYFYMSWNPKYALLLAGSTIVTYASGILLDMAVRTGRERLRGPIVAFSFVVNIGILVIFKYAGFLLRSAAGVLAVLGIESSPQAPNLLLPVGISFYVFQALGYTMDVYRGQIPAEKNIAKYALFVSFFPQLVAGPIERSTRLMGQIHEMETRRLWNYEGIVSGFAMMLWGLFQKMVIADRVALYVDGVWEKLYAVGSVECIFAMLGFSLQIYCDFAGYSAIAIGAARMMGFDLMENFNTPYFATSIADFWRRWHISLSTWFRDYLYIPLGGNRGGKVRKYRNLLITFLVSGLWHGAAWNYVVWGGIHGLYQIVGDLLSPLRKKLCEICRMQTDCFSFTLGQMLVTFVLTSFAWIFFRAPSLERAGYFLNRLIVRWNPWSFFDESIFNYGLDRREAAILLFGVVLLFFTSVVRYFKSLDFGNFLVGQNIWFSWLVMIGMTVCILTFGEYGINFDSASFIYFQF